MCENIDTFQLEQQAKRITRKANLTTKHAANKKISQNASATLGRADLDRFGVWCMSLGEEDLIGTGSTPAEAIEAARVQIRAWEARKA